MTRLHLVIIGRVQAIGYRWFARERAARLKLTGWAANRSDGAVEAEVQGQDKNIKLFIEILKTGHPYARVDSIDKKAVKTEALESSFDIR